MCDVQCQLSDQLPQPAETRPTERNSPTTRLRQTDREIEEEMQQQLLVQLRDQGRSVDDVEMNGLRVCVGYCRQLPVHSIHTPPSMIQHSILSTSTSRQHANTDSVV